MRINSLNSGRIAGLVCRFIPGVLRGLIPGLIPVFVPIFVPVFVLGPVLAGLIGAVLPATGWFPPLGGGGLSLGPVRAFLAEPGLATSTSLSLFTALLATFVSYLLAMGLLAVLVGTGGAGRLIRFISPLLSVPHITIAVGFLFLLQPSGWLIRLFSPWLTGWDRPPNLGLVPDEAGLMLVVGMVAKEVPFLLLMGLSAASQIDARRLLDTARTLGRGPLAAWVFVVQPQLGRRLVLPVMIVLVFAVSVVDMALVLAPSTPPPLAVRILTWFRDPDLDRQFIAAVGALAQVGLALICCGLWAAGAAVWARLVRFVGAGGWRFCLPAPAGRLGHRLVLGVAVLPCLLAAAGLASSVVWAFADIWRFPDALPAKWGVRAWLHTGDGLARAALTSLSLGLAAAAVSVVAAVLWLEATSGPAPQTGQKTGQRTGQRTGVRRTESLIYLPLLVPQIAFLFGLQVLLIWLRVDGLFITLLWVHVVFVYPYVMLSLGPSWRRFDTRFTDLAATLGAGPVRRFWAVKLPIVMIPLLTAFAVGFAVSQALYLPTVFASNGRVATLTTEAVVLAAGAGRQTLGAASVLQMALPLIVFLGVDFIGRMRFHRFSWFRV